MSVQSPAKRSPVLCLHQWANPHDSTRKILIPRIGLTPGLLQPGKTYVCLDCRSFVYIKHHIIAAVSYHMYCNCGFGYSEIQELETLMEHIERSNEKRW